MQLTDLRTSFHGYNKEDVARLIGERDQRCASLEKELEELRARLAQKEKDAGQQPEEAIAEALISAQKFAAHTRAQASEETARMQERAKADADRLLAEARAEAERAHRQLEEELLEKKQEAVQVLAAASQQAEQEARNLAQARAHVAKVRGCIREALFQIDALLSTVGEDETQDFSTLEETSSANNAEEAQQETDENAGLW
ncbi:MAG TPA: DivIVA domain-containing protein [Candidatus Caccousia avicola]|uniref:DivIVA domain-containing protein n=1 Tax=Candidatus Caccousia avicola TaxID=2840721 RepID=A0A9D1AR35_9FIRM|nr:DivIVA domain-containing protein [Candidatus Caccousia avicola]